MTTGARRPELPVLALALVLAAVSEARTFAGLLVCYVAAWALVEASLHTRFAETVRRAPPIGLAALGALALVLLVRQARLLPAEEGLVHWPRLYDRARAAGTPALAPTFLRTDLPTSFVLHAPGAASASLEIAGHDFAATPLGAGALRIDVDPARLELPSGPTSVTLTTDGARRDVTLEVWVPPSHPRGLVLAPDRTSACAVSEETDELLVSTAGGTERRRVEDGASACFFDASGPVAVPRSAFGLARLADVDGAPEVAVAVGQLAGPGLTSALVVAGDAARRTVLDGIADHVALARSPAGLAVIALRAPARLVVVDLSSSAVVAERPLQAPATALWARPASVVMAATDFAEVPAPNLGNHFIDEQIVELSLPDLRVLGVLHPAGRTEAQDHTGDVDAGAGVAGISEDEQGRLVVSFEGTRDVSIYERLDAIASRVSLRRVDAGGDEHAPESAVVLADGTLLVASPASGAILRFRGDEVEVEHLAGTRRELLRTDPEALRVRMGELAFGESTRSGVSCASCHPGGGSDFSGHNIGGRFLAPTLDARGLAGTAPFLRDGSYPRIRDLMEVADHEYRGYRWPAGDRGATIEGFLLRTVRPALGVVRDPDLVRRGGEVFERAGCNQCHAPPAFTDLGQHAGVALFPRHDFPPNVRSLDTPSLRGVAESPPYLHDGRARTLRDVLTTENAANQHGDTEGLDEDALDALVAFLEALP